MIRKMVRGKVVYVKKKDTEIKAQVTGGAYSSVDNNNNKDKLKNFTIIKTTAGSGKTKTVDKISQDKLNKFISLRI
jgi:hypothetical protein